MTVLNGISIAAAGVVATLGLGMAPPAGAQTLVAAREIIERVD